MRVLLFTLLIGLLIPYGGNSQVIQTHRTFGGMRFELDTLTLTHRQVADIISINTAAAMEFRHARRSGALSAILGFGGAFLVAVPVVTAINGGEADWALAAGGGAMLIASVPLSLGYKRRATRAVDIYNSGLPKGRLYIKGAAVGIMF